MSSAELNQECGKGQIVFTYWQAWNDMQQKKIAFYA